MEITNFKDMYLSELQELASVESQLAESLLHMAEVASHPALKSALLHHREETQVQKDRLESILRKHGADPKAHTDQAMEALLKETGKMLTMLKGNNLRDAGLIASAQKLEHYEIAAYGTAAALAGQLDLRDDQQMLHKSLEEEKMAEYSVAMTGIGKHGAARLPSVDVDSFNIELKDDDGFLGDRASKGAFQKILDTQRMPLKKSGNDPLGKPV